MAISSHKRKASSKASTANNDEAKGGQKASSTATATTTTSPRSTAPTISSNKKYKRFKKIFEKTSLQKRHAHANTIQARNEKRNAAAAAAENEAAGAADEQLALYAHKFSRRGLRSEQAAFERSVAELGAKLEFVKRTGVEVEGGDVSDVTTTCQQDPLAVQYVEELRQLEVESSESLRLVKVWHEKQRRAVEHQYKLDHKQAIREFQRKRSDLKKRLVHKYDEMKKQLEVDKALLDINMDLNEMSKLPRTRNLRKRITTNALTYHIDYSVDWLNLEAAAAAAANANANAASAAPAAHPPTAAKSLLLVEEPSALASSPSLESMSQATHSSAGATSDLELDHQPPPPPPPPPHIASSPDDEAAFVADLVLGSLAS